MGREMKFRLFSKTFEVSDPIALIECYCFQSDFYANFDLLNYRKGRKAENVNAIGARMTKDALGNVKTITDNEQTKKLPIFDDSLRLERLLKDDEIRSAYLGDLWTNVIAKLLGINGVRLSTATKVLHTLHPEVIPIIDSQLQETYKNETERRQEPYGIFISYYNNLKRSDNLDNLDFIWNQLISNNLVGLTKVRIFDILCWSYLKSARLTQNHRICWRTIKPALVVESN